MRIEANMVVSLRFVMKNAGGDVTEDIMQQGPVRYLHGSGAILSPLENGIEGLCEGNNKHLDFTIGEERYSIDIVIDNIRPATAEELITGKPAEKTPGGACGPGCCC